MANTFLAALGYSVGASLYEPDLLETTKNLLGKGCEILLPIDVVVAKSLEEQDSVRACLVSDIKGDEKIFDMGPKTSQRILERVRFCYTLIWNGPVGVFEKTPFDKGTTELATGIGNLTRQGSLLSVAGGGDTVAALVHAGVLNDFTYVSTAGGAFLEWLEGKRLPGVLALQKRVS